MGGTATAAVSIPRGSVGAPQIRQDAVRSAEIAKDAVRAPEIVTDAVRAPEIATGAVRSSEIRDSDIAFADISNGARNALQGAQGPAGPQGPAGATNVRIAKEELARVPVCPGTDLRDCADLVELSLGSANPSAARNWLIQAKMIINTPDATANNFFDSCGLVMADNQSPEAVIDDVRVGALPGQSEPKAVALSGVVAESAGNPRMAVRCTVDQGAEIDVADMTITAIEAATLTGP